MQYPNSHKPSFVVSGASKAEQATPRAANCVDLRSQAFAPNFAFICKFIVSVIARGAIAELVSVIVDLLTRMRDINTELLATAAGYRRKRPPDESMRRLQLELPWINGRASNDAENANPTDPSCATDERSNSPQNTDSESKNAKPKKKRNEVRKIRDLTAGQSCRITFRAFPISYLFKADVVQNVAAFSRS